MRDRRAEITDRLTAVLTPVATSNQYFFWRNRGSLEINERPAIVVCDTDEIAEKQAFGKGRMSIGPNLVMFTPEIIVTLRDHKPKNTEIGTLLNTMRRSIIVAVLFDDQLNEIVGSNGEIRYQGCSTDLGNERAMNGEMQVVMTFVYPFIPNELRG